MWTDTIIKPALDAVREQLAKSEAAIIAERKLPTLPALPISQGGMPAWQREGGPMKAICLAVVFLLSSTFGAFALEYCEREANAGASPCYAGAHRTHTSSKSCRFIWQDAYDRCKRRERGEK
jgi:hypothetical protein